MRTIISVLVVAAIMITGCGMSTDDMSTSIKVTLQGMFNEGSLQVQELHVEGVQVVKRDKNVYVGIASVRYNGLLHNVFMFVVVDGKKLTFQLDPDSLLFVN